MALSCRWALSDACEARSGEASEALSAKARAWKEVEYGGCKAWGSRKEQQSTAGVLDLWAMAGNATHTHEDRTETDKESHLGPNRWGQRSK